jgi:fructosamine-3-kinase
MFGFPVPTCCGETRQDNTWTESWADFYAEHRLRAVLKVGGWKDEDRSKELGKAVERVAGEVVPRLLGDGHLKGVQPVVVHGDLWSGNHGTGRIAGKGGVEEVVFDPSCVYGHSEYELGIMRMFGGFGSAFWTEYESLVPKAEPEDEWEDRLALYELWVCPCWRLWCVATGVLIDLQVPSSQPLCEVWRRISKQRLVHHAEADLKVRGHLG